MFQFLMEPPGIGELETSGWSSGRLIKLGVLFVESR